MPRTETDARKLQKTLAELSDSVSKCLRAIDKVMQERESMERGKKIAAICNALELANDHVRYFTLGVDYRTDAQRK